MSSARENEGSFVQVVTADCLDFLRNSLDDEYDMIFASPPYSDVRSYDIGFSLTGQEWVDWCFERYVECVRVCKGLVAWVVDGPTRKFQYSCGPELLMADLHRAGFKLRKPPIFHRNGIPGSGGPDWLRNDYERIICASKGRLPWSDNTACGAPPRYTRGGRFSHQTRDGRLKNGKAYPQPAKANPGNVLKFNVGKGHMGSDFAHQNEAPYPESLVEFFVRSFCPSGGYVLDPFGGSGSTAAVCYKLGRDCVSVDIRESQTKVALERLDELQSR